MIKHSKIRNELATKMCIRLHEMITLVLRFCRNILKYDKTSENPKWAGIQNVCTSSRNADPFVHFVKTYEHFGGWLMTLLLRFSGISENMIKHSKIQNELATKMCIRLHEMITLLLRFFRNIIKYDKTSENHKWVGLQNVHTSSRNDDPFVTFFQEYHKIW